LPLCLTRHNAMKTFVGVGGIAPSIPNLGARWRCVVSLTPRPLYPRYPFDRRLGVTLAKRKIIPVSVGN